MPAPSQAFRPATVLFAWLALPACLALVPTGLEAQQRATPEGIHAIDHQPPEGPNCGQWGQLGLSACSQDGPCRPERLSPDQAVDLYDLIDERVESLIAETCEARRCPGFEIRSDRNQLDCRGGQTTCMSRELLYRCMAALEPDAGPAARRTPETETARPVLDAGAARAVLAAARPEVDLAFTGHLSLGGRNVEWGNVIALSPADAESVEDGRCRFRYRYASVNQGANLAGAHVNRLRLGEHVLLAETSVNGIEAGRRAGHSGLITLWSGENLLYAHLDDAEQLNDVDRSNNIRRVRVELAEGCADPTPRPRQLGDTRQIPRPVGRHQPPEPATPAGTRAPTTAPPPRPGTRAAPRQGRPAPGTQSKPVPEDAADCRPELAATRVTGVTRTGARTSAILAWEASAFALHGGGFSWDSASGKSTQCNLQFGWTCTVRGRPCRN